jgi:hypothetical protein
MDAILSEISLKRKQLAEPAGGESDGGSGSKYVRRAELDRAREEREREERRREDERKRVDREKREAGKVGWLESGTERNGVEWRASKRLGA